VRHAVSSGQPEFLRMPLQLSKACVPLFALFNMDAHCHTCRAFPAEPMTAAAWCKACPSKFWRLLAAGCMSNDYA
jgi:hypothetical protein